MESTYLEGGLLTTEGKDIKSKEFPNKLRSSRAILGTTDTAMADISSKPRASNW